MPKVNLGEVKIGEINLNRDVLVMDEEAIEKGNKWLIVILFIQGTKHISMNTVFLEPKRGCGFPYLLLFSCYHDWLCL